MIANFPLLSIHQLGEIPVKYLRILFLGLACVASGQLSFPLHAEQDDSNVPRPPKLDLESSRPQQWAVLIGVDDYAEISDLQYCSSDVRGLRDRLIAAGFAADNVFLMNDGAAEQKYLPSKANIERQLEVVLKLADEEDLLLVAFCGHAIEADGKSYLCSMEARRGALDETLVPLQYVYRQLSSCPARRKLLLIDTARNISQPGWKATEGFVKSLQDPPKGVCCLIGCRGGQVSLLDGKLERGVFMHHLARGLEGEADRDGGNGDEQISLAELFDYVRRNTERYAVEKNLVQTPTLLPEETPDFQIGTVPAYVPKEFAWPGLDDNSEAIPADLETLTNIDPRSLRALRRAWNPMAMQFGADRAIADCTEAIRLDPNNGWAYIWRGFLYRKKGDIEKAMHDYKKLGIPLPCYVYSRTAELKLGDKVVATLSRRDIVYVTKANGDWFWVKGAGEASDSSGWIHKSDIQ